jgi:diguanylate cyclase (GGDEF)-like protein
VTPEDEIAALKAELQALKARLAAAELLADRDPLSPLLNRRAFVRELSRTLAYCERYKAEASLVYFDLDGFKAVNDRFGHAAGDAALEHISGILWAHVRESDLAGRLGGDEFAVVLAHAGRGAAEAKAMTLAAEIEASPAGHQGRAIPLSISYGVRAFEPGMTAAQMMAEADAAMYLNKARRKAG